MNASDQEARMKGIVDALYDALRCHMPDKDGLRYEDFEIVIGALGCIAAGLFGVIPDERERHEEILVWAATIASSANYKDKATLQ